MINVTGVIRSRRRRAGNVAFMEKRSMYTEFVAGKHDLVY